MIRKSIAILKRNFNIILNTKLSFIIIFLGPMLLMFIVGGILQNTQLRELNIGIYTPNNQDLYSDAFITGFIENLLSGGHSVGYEESLEICKQKVLDMETHACVEILKKDSYQIVTGESVNTPSYDLTSHVDYSQTRTAWRIIETIQWAAEQETYELTQGKIKSAVDEIDGVINELRVQSQDLNSLQNRLSSINVNLGNMNSDLSYLNSNLNQANSDLISVKNELTSFASSHPEYAVILSFILGDVNNANSKIANALNQIDSINSKSSTSVSDINSISSQLMTVGAGLNQVINKWDQLKNTNLNEISKPITYKAEPLQNRESYQVESLGFIDYVFPTFLMFFTIFVCLVFPTSITIRERKTRAYIRNVTSRTSGFQFVFNNFLSCILIISAQTVILLLISKLFINANIMLQLPSILFLMAICVSALSLIGMFLGYLFNSFESAIIASISLSVIILVLLPGVTPTDMLPPVISQIVEYSIPVLMENNLRTMIIFGAPLSLSGAEILSVLGTGVISIIGLAIIYTASKRREV